MHDVKTWMTRPPLTIDPSASALEAIELMQEGGLRHLPVLTSLGELVGIVSIDDLRAALPFEVSLRAAPSERTRIDAREYTVAELMTYAPTVIDPEAPLARAARALVHHHIGCLPVVDRAGKLVGIFTESDALWALASLLEPSARPAERLEGLRKLACQLRGERDRILAQLGRRHRAERAMTAEAEEPMDAGELGELRTEMALSETLADLAVRRLNEIELALDRETRGQLGVCGDCSEAIPLGRLRALPGTERCVRCAEVAERARSQER
jgi:CBS domain-containing protein/RNA polymerase-binding transcription factor DksA